MEYQLRKSFTQFDRQTNDRVISHIEMNNLYLQIERGDIEMNMDTGNQLWSLNRATYPPREGDPMGAWWESEFEKLPGWNCW